MKTFRGCRPGPGDAGAFAPLLDESATISSDLVQSPGESRPGRWSRAV